MTTANIPTIRHEPMSDIFFFDGENGLIKP